MKNRTLAIVATLLLALAASAGVAQEQKTEEKPGVAAPKDLSEIEQLRLKVKIQTVEAVLKDMNLLETQAQVVQRAYREAQENKTKVERELQDHIAAIYSEKKIDRKEWQLDPATGKFTRRQPQQEKAP